jgi:carbon monoxide dehydrogenase subunit G
MTLAIPVELGYEFEVKAPFQEVFGVLADVPTSASFYPHVDQLVDVGGGAYRWEMAKIGLPQISLQTIYTSRYVANKAKGTITWSPVDGDAHNNARVSGSWHITARKASTLVVLRVQGELSVPLPALTKMVVAPVVEAEFERLTEQYIANLVERFGGEV